MSKIRRLERKRVRWNCLPLTSARTKKRPPRPLEVKRVFDRYVCYNVILQPFFPPSDGKWEGGNFVPDWKLISPPMIGENLQLVTNEPVEFEK